MPLFLVKEKLHFVLNLIELVDILTLLIHFNGVKCFVMYINSIIQF